MSETVKEIFYIKTESGEEVTVTIEGQTDMPSWNHDLKLKVILGLLQTVDYKDFIEDDKTHLLVEYAQKIRAALGIAVGE